MGPRALAVLIIVAIGLGGCVIVQPNPEGQRCAAACLEEKNGCLVAATTAEAVAACDTRHRACAQPCQPLRRELWR